MNPVPEIKVLVKKGKKLVEINYEKVELYPYSHTVTGTNYLCAKIDKPFQIVSATEVEIKEIPVEVKEEDGKKKGKKKKKVEYIKEERPKLLYKGKEGDYLMVHPTFTEKPDYVRSMESHIFEASYRKN